MNNIQVNKFDKFIKIYKITLIVLYSLVTLFLTSYLIYQFFDDLNSYKNGEDFILGLAAVFIFIIILVGAISYSILEILSLIGLCAVVSSKTVTNKAKNKRFFIWTSIINIITYGILIGLSRLLIGIYQNITK